MIPFPPQILIPTKTGKEPPKKLYPKEPNPDQLMMGQPRLGQPIQPGAVALGPLGGPHHAQPARFLAFPGGQCHVSVGSAPMAFSSPAAGQPHSLPVIPVISAAPVAFAR